MHAAWRKASRTAESAWRRFVADSIPGHAAEMSFYFFLCMFPMLLILMAVLGMFLDAQLLLRGTVLDSIARVAPDSMLSVFDRLLEHLTQTPERPLSFGIVIAVWAASSGMVATIRALNEVYDVEEQRPWWRRRVVGVLLTLALMLLMVATMVLVAYGGPIAEGIARRAGFGTAFVHAWHLGQWVAIVTFLLIAFHLLYRFAPNHRQPAARWLQPGTLIGIALWLAASFGLKLYVATVARYDVAYGSLGAVIVLLLWFYVTAIAVLTGAQINAHQARIACDEHTPARCATR